MAKVVSTKLKVDELARFTVMAEQQGETKAGLLRRLVLECLINGDKVGDVDSAGRSDLYKRVIDGLPVKKTGSGNSQPSCRSIEPHSPLIREDHGSTRLACVSQQSHTKLPTPDPSVVISKLRHRDMGGRSNTPTPFKSRLPVYLNDSRGRLKASNTSSTIGGIFLLLFLMSLRHKCQSS